LETAVRKIEGQQHTHRAVPDNPALHSILEFAATEYGRSSRVIASDEIKTKILEIGINKCARESGFHRANFIRKLVRGLPVKRNSYEEFLRWLENCKDSK